MDGKLVSFFDIGLPKMKGFLLPKSNH